MSDIFNDDKMMYVLSQYIPENEHLTAGIHCISKYAKLSQPIGKCMMLMDESGLVPVEDGVNTLVIKEKFAACDLYMGLTENHLIITECDRNSWAYKFEDLGELNAPPLEKPLPLHETGPRCFSFDEIVEVKLKKGLMGAVKCTLTFKGNCSYKLLMPKMGGVGNGMPNHSQRRDTIVEFLKQYA